MLAAHERMRKKMHGLPTIMHDHMLALGLCCMHTASGAEAPEARAMATTAAAAAAAALEARVRSLRGG